MEEKMKKQRKKSKEANKDDQNKNNEDSSEKDDAEVDDADQLQRQNEENRKNVEFVGNNVRRSVR